MRLFVDVISFVFLSNISFFLLTLHVHILPSIYWWLDYSLLPLCPSCCSVRMKVFMPSFLCLCPRSVNYSLILSISIFYLYFDITFLTKYIHSILKILCCFILIFITNYLSQHLLIYRRIGIMQLVRALFFFQALFFFCVLIVYLHFKLQFSLLQCALAFKFPTFRYMFITLTDISKSYHSSHSNPFLLLKTICSVFLLLIDYPFF